jgi:hypothetical protein
MAWTQKKVEGLKAGAKTRWLQENNLCIKVDPSGHIAYYCDLDRKKHHLGNHPLITLRQARKKKDLLYNDHCMGKAEVTKQTFAEFVRGKDFVDWSKGSRTTHEARMASMERTILPILGKVKLARLDQADITRCKKSYRSKARSPRTPIPTTRPLFASAAAGTTPCRIGRCEIPKYS